MPWRSIQSLSRGFTKQRVSIELGAIGSCLTLCQVFPPSAKQYKELIHDGDEAVDGPSSCEDNVSLIGFLQSGNTMKTLGLHVPCYCAVLARYPRLLCEG